MKYELWQQVREVKIGEMLFKFDDLDIDFEITKTNDTKTNQAVIFLYNLAETTKEKIKKGLLCTVRDGYKNYNKVSFNGIVDKVNTYRDGEDFVTRIIATPSNVAFTNTAINVQFKVNIRPSEILKTLNSITPYTIEIMDLPKDTPYPGGKIFSNRLSKVIEILGRDTGAKVNVDENRIYFKQPSKAYSKAIRIGTEEGLINIEKLEDKTNKERYLIETLMIPDIVEDAILEIDSKYYPGTYRVVELTRSAQGLEEFSVYAVAEVVKNNGK